MITPTGVTPTITPLMTVAVTGGDGKRTRKDGIAGTIPITVTTAMGVSRGGDIEDGAGAMIAMKAAMTVAPMQNLVEAKREGEEGDGEEVQIIRIRNTRTTHKGVEERGDIAEDDVTGAPTIQMTMIVVMAVKKAGGEDDVIEEDRIPLIQNMIPAVMAKGVKDENHAGIGDGVIRTLMTIPEVDTVAREERREEDGDVAVTPPVIQMIVTTPDDLVVDITAADVIVVIVLHTLMILKTVGDIAEEKTRRKNTDGVTLQVPTIVRLVMKNQDGKRIDEEIAEEGATTLILIPTLAIPTAVDRIARRRRSDLPVPPAAIPATSARKHRRED